MLKEVGASEVLREHKSERESESSDSFIITHQIQKLDRDCKYRKR